MFIAAGALRRLYTSCRIVYVVVLHVYRQHVAKVRCRNVTLSVRVLLLKARACSGLRRSSLPSGCLGIVDSFGLVLGD